MGDDDLPVNIGGLLEKLGNGASVLLLGYETKDMAKNPNGFMTGVIIRRSVFDSLDKAWVERGFDTLFFHCWLQVLIAMNGGTHQIFVEKHYEGTVNQRVSFMREARFAVPWVRFRYWCLWLALEKGKNRAFFTGKFLTSFLYLPILVVRNIVMSLTNRDLVTEAYTANQVRKFKDGY
jgi:hypothetical protein